VQPPAAPANDEITPRDVTFVVDTSSSMKGLPLDQARAVIRRIVRGLGSSDRVNILAFADRVIALGDAPIAAGEETTARVDRFLGELRTVGATRMIPAIERALAQPAPGASRLDVVVLLTDGFVGNETEVLRAVANGLDGSRLYTIGLGASPNRFLLERAAEVGRGRSFVAAPTENAPAVAERFATLVEKPVFTDVEIDWGGLAVSDVYPTRLPDLFAGKPLVVHGRFTRGGRATVKVRGSIRGRRFEREVEVVLPSQPTRGDTGAHATLWARAAIHSRLASLWMRETPGLVESVTELGLAHRIVTPYTSFVAVEERASTGEEEARLTVTPSRALPGDPEIRIPAPRDARQVTVVLPFGETVAAEWESALGVWSARFLIPRDTPEGNYPIDVFVTHADGHDEHIRVWYTVDATAPEVDLEVVSGELRAGEEVIVRAPQRGSETIGGVAVVRRVELRIPEGDVIDMGIAGRGVWEARFRVPNGVTGRLPVSVFAIDLAANVGEQQVILGGAR
jgi:Ca-activated chloride channel family protein